MLWAQNPGRQENLKGLELVGPSGELVWETAREVGLSRKDFDVQNVVRCYTVDSLGEEHSPTPEELHCCSVYNERALERNRGEAVVHLILGKVAGVQLLGKDYKKDRPVFWYEPWKAYVVLAEHPSYLLRLGGRKCAGWKYYHFRDMFGAVRQILDHPGPYGYVLGQKYKTIQNDKGLQWLDRVVRREAAAGRRVAVDIEDGEVDGQKVLLLCGFSWGHLWKQGDWSTYVGGAGTLVFDHPEGEVPEGVKRRFYAWLRAVMDDPTVGKSFQHGSYDQPELERYLGCAVRGYTFDSQYGAYLRFPHLKSYSLEKLAVNFFPEFGNYKTMVQPYFVDGFFPEFGNYKTMVQPYFVDGKCDMARVPLKVLAPYNCADADLTKRVELKVGESISQPLLEVYIQAAFTLEDMETRGPWLDMENFAGVKAEVPKEVARLRKTLQQLAGDPEFNPGSPLQVGKLLYDQLKLGDGSTRSTAKEVLRDIGRGTGHKAPGMIVRYRALTKVDSTYLDGWRASAEQHEGQLRTRWHLTGAATGRLRSGGDKDSTGGVVNFQNFHGNKLLLDLLVADPEWRRALSPATPLSELGDLWVFLAADYSQIELRMLAEICGDPILLKSFQTGEDIHRRTAAEIFGTPLKEVTDDQRQAAKKVNFGIVYGQTPSGLATQLGIPTRKAERYLEQYFARYTKVAGFFESMEQRAEDVGSVDTLFGFTRELGKWDTDRNTFWGNQARNTPLQGSAHQLVLVALALLRQRRSAYRLLRHGVLEVHDALYFFVRLRDVFEAAQQLNDLLQNKVATYVARKFGRKLKVPLVSDNKVGFTLGSMTDLRGEDVSVLLQDWRGTREKNLKEGWEKLELEEQV
jgi:uracil-DNA glycosylase family 4